MNALTLQWHDDGKNYTQTIYENQSAKNLGTVRIGRDPVRCDIVLSHPTVSGLHIEIFFNLQQHSFMVRNLRSQNPPLIDGQRLVHGELQLHAGSVIFLGQVQLLVISVPEESNVAATVLASPQQQPHRHHQQQPPQQQPRQPLNLQGNYGLECPNCHRISPPKYLDVGCPWCGTSLAAAVSVLVSPKN
ncbi:FHA domain-containing protein [Calothrix sp. PCC 6303]|uniref:FHA domain-containing protein n=1 Tax=Calothrix sp. PCC 6303 TaxID=1170562 RepID=UPI0002A045DB|nr:FHA domain-containing protein [Calothrix sp. PCC 6303]AFZ04300.1 Forkhead-associated protein [Calothrix sp. PCC 6303]